MSVCTCVGTKVYINYVCICVFTCMCDLAGWCNYLVVDRPWKYHETVKSHATPINTSSHSWTREMVWGPDYSSVCLFVCFIVIVLRRAVPVMVKGRLSNLVPGITSVPGHTDDRELGTNKEGN